MNPMGHNVVDTAVVASSGGLLFALTDSGSLVGTCHTCGFYEVII